ncbi:hypothetical protein [Flavobacterium sp. S87F.05.LMB.W.Kidney.N]|uniref:hypothetical protein n=1 Tax=Flavobacterium sp. S87F.05.LMB.W.Kidney.N TaxID=1278758 RepID=UPI0010650094|nr:hypothetical protein [Flavobacterium sp. S87F.05.LMB.W.Kidney.N]TDX09449.1 hypothetical protein EDB96_3748 [Flavobacterium sp. S87F.05.LMB.W.Kidney.N]
METQQKAVTELLEIVNKGNYFNKLKPNNDSLSATLNVSCYSELNIIVTALLKASITMLQSENSTKPFSDAMVLVEMALQLLPNDEMELLDEVFRVELDIKK